MPSTGVFRRSGSGLPGRQLSLWAATTSVESRPVLLHVIVPLGALYLAFKYTTASQSSRDTSIATAQGSRG